jgi:hypothetical protein
MMQLAKLVIPKPGLSARNLLDEGSLTADSSREMPRFGMTRGWGADCTDSANSGHIDIHRFSVYL